MTTATAKKKIKSPDTNPEPNTTQENKEIGNNETPEKVEGAIADKPVTRKRKNENLEIKPELYAGQEKKSFGYYERPDMVEEAMAKKAICQGVIRLVDKKGLAYVDYEGVEGIIPKDELDTRSLKGLIGFVGRQIVFVIKGYDKEANVFVASRKEALEIRKKIRLEDLNEGDVVAGTVVRVEPWGCIMDIGGVLGRLSISEMQHGYVSDVNNVVEKNDYFDVLVKRITHNAEGENRITLSLKDLLPVPWERVAKRYIPKATAVGKVTGFFRDTVFVELEKGVEGLADVDGYKLEKGQQVKAYIGKIDNERKRIRLRIVGVIGR